MASTIPLLPEKHSGIPKNLFEKARKAKALIDKTRTKTPNLDSRLAVVPQGIGRVQLFEALEELGGQLGKENVEVNDKPLVDGWYMERE